MTYSKPNWFVKQFSTFLMKQLQPARPYLCDFQVIREEVRPGDVLLIEGHSRASRIIKEITQSAWSHATLYIGHYEDIKAFIPEAQKQYYESYSARKPCLIESEVGYGTIMPPLDKYQNAHIRLARPRGLKKEDTEQVIRYALSRLGTHYHIRHIFDLARFLFPWTFFPRRWRSVLFEHNAKQPTHDICSSLIATAFQSIEYPILPKIDESKNKQYRFTHRNPKLYTPSDFDYSPYFDIIKYPIIPSKHYESIVWEKGKVSDE